MQHTWEGWVNVEPHGSGAVIREDGLILTAAHVVLDESGYPEGSYDIDFHNDVNVPAVLLWYDEVQDIALLYANRHCDHVLELAPAGSLLQGDDLWAVGFPKDLGLTITHGTNCGLRTMSLDNIYNDLLLSDVHVLSGNSGGPVLNSEGQVIGIVVIRLTASRMTMIVPASDIRAMLHDLEINGPLL
jgi:S1-C subfamily serine protease